MESPILLVESAIRVSTSRIRDSPRFEFLLWLILFVRVST